MTTQAVGGDADALNRLLGRCDPQLRARIGPEIRRLDGLVADLEDVLQVTYVDVFLRIGRFEHNGPGSFLAWLTHIARNNIKDALRAARRVKRTPPGTRLQPGSDESYVRLLSNLAGRASTPSRSLRRAERKSLIEDALAKLPPDYAAVVRLYDLDNLPTADVAETLGRSVGAVYMLKARAHDRLAELLSEPDCFSSFS